MANHLFLLDDIRSDMFFNLLDKLACKYLSPSKFPQQKPEAAKSGNLHKNTQGEKCYLCFPKLHNSTC